MEHSKLFEKTLKVLGLDPVGLSYELDYVDQNTIRELNKKYRGVDKPTDVLSFPIFNKGEKIFGCLGNIVICREVSSDFSEEFLFVHSVLHLLGFTHETDEDYDIMYKLTQEVLADD